MKMTYSTSDQISTVLERIRRDKVLTRFLNPSLSQSCDSRDENFSFPEFRRDSKNFSPYGNLPIYTVFPFKADFKLKHQSVQNQISGTDNDFASDSQF